MKYEPWAPSELVELHKKLTLNNYNGAANASGIAQANIDARKSGFKMSSAWMQHEKHIFEILQRLISRPEMEGFWSWGYTENREFFDASRLFYRFREHIHFWQKCAPFSKIERYDELRQISNLAKELADKLANFTSEPFLNFGYEFLLSDSETGQLEARLHPDALKKIPLYGLQPPTIKLVNKILPSIDTMLKRVSTVAKNATIHHDLHPSLPRKRKDKNALRTYLITHVHQDFLIQSCTPSPSKVALFLSVALDDADITPDLVRKIAPVTPDEKAFILTSKDSDSKRFQ